MIALNGHILRNLDIVDALENGQAMADAVDAHRLEIIVQQRNESLANDLVFCVLLSLTCRLLTDSSPLGHLPINLLEYCSNPIVAMKSAHSSAVHSDIMVSGSLSALVR